MRSIIAFIRNVWRFRRELWRWRWWDFDYSYELLVRGLEQTRDAFAAGKGLSEGGAETAAEISIALHLWEQYKGQDAAEITSWKELEAAEQLAWNAFHNRLRDHARGWWD